MILFLMLYILVIISCHTKNKINKIKNYSFGLQGSSYSYTQTHTHTSRSGNVTSLLRVWGGVLAAKDSL